jgi:SAM-dependent methyltransferase
MDDKVKPVVEMYPPEEVGEYYNRVMPEVVKRVDIKDTMQGCRPKDTQDLHEYIIKTAELADGQMILDAGCGLGGPSMYFAAKLNVTLHSWTNSTFCYGYFKENAEKRKLELKGKVNPTLNDYHKIAEVFAPQTFDRVLFLESFLHTRTPKELLASVRTVLKDDGILYLKEICTEDYSNSPDKEKIARAVEIGNEHFKFHYLPVVELKQILEESGFEVLICRKPQFENFLDLGNEYLYEVVGLDFFEKAEPVMWSDCFEFKCIKKK